MYETLSPNAKRIDASNLLVNTDIKMGGGYMIIDSGQPTASRKGIVLHESDIVVRRALARRVTGPFGGSRKFATFVLSSTGRHDH
jgi:hypothetical protein